jgi:hypothetical protein
VGPNSVFGWGLYKFIFRCLFCAGRRVEDCSGSLTAGGLFVRSDSHVMFCLRHVLVWLMTCVIGECMTLGMGQIHLV